LGYLVFTAVSLAASQALGDGASLGVGGGWVIPAADFAEVAESGWHVAASLDFPATSRLSLGLAGDYSPLKATDEFMVASGAEPGTFDEGKVQLWWAGARGDVLLSQGQTIPFLRGGVGAYGIKTKVTTLFFGDQEDSEVKAGLELGGGLLFRPELAGAVELGAAYHLVFGGDTRFAELCVLWRFGGRNP
jgi:opacity protein-like surface antigen